MGNFSANWELIASSKRLQRSSQTVSVVGSQVLITGGEVIPRQPVDNQVDIVELDQGKTRLYNMKHRSQLTVAFDL
jgi:hypothetical protein